MKKRYENYDVFLSYSLADRPTAETVRLSLIQAGLQVFDPGCVKPGLSLTEAVWHALAVSEALVAVIPADGDPTPNTATELGAAMAWSKPIYLLRQENGRSRTPSFLSSYGVYPVSRVDDVASAIKRGQKPLSSDELEVLKKVYLNMQTPTDQFLRDPALVDRLAQEFRARARSQIAGERLLHEMLRLRKQGRWPRLSRPSAAKTRS